MKVKLLKKIGIVSALLIAAFGAIYLSTAKSADASWWPSRPIKTYTSGVKGFDAPTFDSFQSTPVYGFEPVFYTVKNITTEPASGPFHDTTSAKNGDIVSFRIYGHNGADPSLNGTNFNGPGVAHNSHVLAALPATEGASLTTAAYISASNTTQPVVADTATITSSSGGNIKLQFIAGSGYIVNNHFTSPHTLPDSLVTAGTVADPALKGALIGYDSMNGNVPGCFQYDFDVFYRAKVVSTAVTPPPTTPAMTVSKKVSTDGGTTYVDANDAASAPVVHRGDTVKYSLKVTSTGTANLTNVTIRDTLPAGQTLVAGSEDIATFDSATNSYITHPIAGSDDALLFSGTGRTAAVSGAATLAPNIGATVHFSAKINPDVTDGQLMTNTEFAKSTEIPTISDVAITKASVTVTPQGFVIEKAKSAFNETQGLDATAVKAHAADTIRYDLVTKNSGDAVAPGVVVSDDISDILQYADVTDLGGATVSNGTISWPAQDIAAGATVTSTFKVKVKPVAQWPDGGDLTMTNTYGNTVNVQVESQPSTPTPVTPQGGVSVLPNTGPSETLLAILLGVGMLGYFARRSYKDYVARALDNRIE